MNFALAIAGIGLAAWSIWMAKGTDASVRATAQAAAATLDRAAKLDRLQRLTFLGETLSEFIDTNVMSGKPPAIWDTWRLAHALAAVGEVPELEAVARLRGSIAEPDSYAPDDAPLKLYDDAGEADRTQLIPAVVLALKELNASLRQARP